MAMKAVPLCSLALSAVVFCELSLAAPSAELEELKACARVEDREARFSCYEALGQRVLAADSEAGATPAAAAAATSAVAAPAAEDSATADTIGGYRFEQRESDEDPDALATRVVECQKNVEGTWYFRLENGQVWKQVDRQTLNFQACDFPATVGKDGLGYVLKIEGRKGKIRISRRK